MTLSRIFGLGIFWLAIGLFVSSTTKLYQQISLAILIFPGLLCAIKYRYLFKKSFLENRALWLSIIFFLVWAALSITWSDTQSANDLKYIAMIMALLAGVPSLEKINDRSKEKAISIALAITAIVVAIMIPFSTKISDLQLSTRYLGVGLLMNPLSVGIACGFMACICLLGMPTFKGALITATPFVLIVILSGSRTPILAMGLSCIAWLAWNKTDNRARFFGGCALACALLGVILFSTTSFMHQRGISWRDSIFYAVIDMVKQNPWGGIGFASGYSFELQGYKIAHAHSMFGDIAIHVGIIGVILWASIVILSIRLAWPYRTSLIGGAALMAWAYSLIATMFDIANPLTKPELDWLFTWIPVTLSLVAASQSKQWIKKNECV